MSKFHQFVEPRETEAEHMPTFTLDRQIARARHDMGDAKWAQLNREWSSYNG